MRREGGVVFLRLHLWGTHRDMGRGGGASCPSHRCEGKQRCEGGRVSNVGQVNLGRVAQRGHGGVLKVDRSHLGSETDL